MENNKEARLKSKETKNKILMIGGIFLMFLGLVLLLWGIVGGVQIIIEYQNLINEQTNIGITNPNFNKLNELPFYAFMLFSGTIMFTSSFFVLSKRKL